MSIFKISIIIIFLIYYSRYLSSKLCIGMLNEVNCVSIMGRREYNSKDAPNITFVKYNSTYNVDIIKLNFLFIFNPKFHCCA